MHKALRSFFLPVICVAGGLLAGLLNATTVVPVNFDQLVANADRVFIGTCSSVEAGSTPEGLPYTAYTFSVAEVLKGDVGAAVTLRQLGLLEPQRVGGNMVKVFRIQGMPTYKVGQKFLLFLRADSELGLASPIGLFQGAFSIGLDAEGAKVAVNGSNNVNLFQGMDNLPAVATAHRIGPVKLSLLLDLIRQRGQ